LIKGIGECSDLLDEARRGGLLGRMDGSIKGNTLKVCEKGQEAFWRSKRLKTLKAGLLGGEG